MAYPCDSIHVFDTAGCGVQYKGIKLTDALTRLSKALDFNIFVDGQGKIYMAAHDNQQKNNLLITRDNRIDFKVNIDKAIMINKRGIGYGYSVTSNYFPYFVYGQNSISVDSFGVHEELLADETTWFVNSTTATSRSHYRLNEHPPKGFDITIGLEGATVELNDTIRLVESFYDVTSSDEWQIIEHSVNMNDGTIDLKVIELY